MEDNSSNKEPIYTAGIAGGAAVGATYLVLQEPIQNILLEMGASDRLSRSLVTLTMFVLPIAVSILTSWWARKRVVTLAVANDKIQQAFDMPIGTPQRILEDLKVSANVETETKS